MKVGVATAERSPATPVALSDRSRIDVAYADTRANDLSFALGLEPFPALVRRLALVAGLEVDLRILGGSHQVLVASGGSRLMSETVACLSREDVPTAQASVPLPAEHRQDVASPLTGRLEYRMTSRVARLSRRRQAVDTLMTTLDTAPTGVLGVFPGHPHAFTGLQVLEQPDGIAWRSWHAYPQTDELVLTSTRLTGVAR